MRRLRKQLAPDDAYLSCEYSLPAGWHKRAKLMEWQITMFDVSSMP